LVYFLLDGKVIGCSSSFIYFQRVAFKALGMLIFDVGLMLAYHCDQYGKTRSTILSGFRQRHCCLWYSPSFV